MMRIILSLLVFLAICSFVQAEFVGAELPLEDFGTPDSWSGIPVTYGYQLPPGESVSTVRYYADDDRIGVEDGLYNLVPLIVQQVDGSTDDGEGFFSIWEVGPAHTPTELGENEFTWGSPAIPDDGSLYHPAVLQWQIDLDNTDGGFVTFNDVGEGMHYFDIDTTDYVPGEDLGDVEAGFELGGIDEPLLTLHSSPAGGRHYQISFETTPAVAGTPGDFDADGELTANDINLLTKAVDGVVMGDEFDLNGDGTSDQDDRTAWVKDLKNTWFGDANLDGEFNSSDFVIVFQALTFEANSVAFWETGDWDGDGVFTSSDFVVAFQDGGYELGPRAAEPVPEPTAWGVMGLGSFMVFTRVRRLRR